MRILDLNRQIVYIKAEQSCQIDKNKIQLKDILEIECADKEAEGRIGEIPVAFISDNSAKRKVISVLEIISLIHLNERKMIVVNEGENEIILEHTEKQKKSAPRFYLKTISVMLITFAGSAFSIMSFNNDIAVTKLFNSIYYLMTGNRTNSITVLDIFYSIGIGVGILMFFDHFGKNKFSDNPTPTEIELKKYKKDSQSVIIENSLRKEKD